MVYLVYIGVYGINIGDLSTHFYANIYSSFSFSQMIIDTLLILSPLSEQLFWFTFAWMNSDFLRSLSWKIVDEDYICIKHILPGCHPTRADQTKSTKCSSGALLLWPLPIQWAQRVICALILTSLINTDSISYTDQLLCVCSPSSWVSQSLSFSSWFTRIPYS